MEPYGSFLHSQQPITYTYPEPVNAPIPLLEDSFQYYLPLYASVFQVVSFPQVSP